MPLFGLVVENGVLGPDAKHLFPLYRLLGGTRSRVRAMEAPSTSIYGR